MLSSSASKRTRASKADPTSDAAESPDRRALIYLLNFLLEGFERISSNGDPPASSPSERLDQWSNDDYMYIETRIPDDLSGLEMDLGLVNGVIFADSTWRRALAFHALDDGGERRHQEQPGRASSGLLARRKR